MTERENFQGWSGWVGSDAVHHDLAALSHHLFEGVLNGSYHQALVLDLLLCEEARRGRRRAARGTGRACCPSQRGGARQGAVRARDASLEVGVVVGLFPQHGGRWGAQVAQDLDDGLELAGDVVLQQAGGDDGCTWSSVTIKQSPVVKRQPFTVLQTQCTRSYYIFMERIYSDQTDFNRRMCVLQYTWQTAVVWVSAPQLIPHPADIKPWWTVI